VYRFFLSTFFLLAIPAFTQGVDAAELSRMMDELYRADSSQGQISMSVTTPHYDRTISMKVWSLGMDYTLVRIETPRKDKGVSTLKRETEMWNYLPKIKKLVRIPPSMMMGSWMGSDFTNDDLVRESSWQSDYNVTAGPLSDGKVDLIFEPKPNAPVTWQKVITRVDMEAQLPLYQEFYDEKGRKVRIITFDLVKEMGGRTIPTRMTLTPLLKEGHKTVVVYTELNFGVSLETSFFTKTELKKGRSR